MTTVTYLLDAAEAGDPHAAAQLLPIVYDELRRLAAHRLAQESPWQTLTPTALVHETYLRLVGAREEVPGSAAATSSRWPPKPCAASWWRTPAANIASSAAVTRRPCPGEEAELPAPEPHEDVLALDEALTELVVNRVENDYSVNNLSTRHLR
jgi:hypothetical protein